MTSNTSAPTAMSARGPREVPVLGLSISRSGMKDDTGG
jgi:hypothetical protein